MASIDKNTVRNEVNRIKSDFDALCNDGKISNDIKLLMSSLLMVVDLILSIFLEKKTKKDSNNSSIPSSQTDEDNTALPQTGSKGKGKKENSSVAGNTRTRESISISEVNFCDVCGEDLSGEKRRFFVSNAYYCYNW